MEYFVYIVKCSDDTLYTGITTDIKRRIRQHNKEIKGGASYTSGRCPVELTYSEKTKTKSEALSREASIKKLTRQEKIDLINKSN